VLPPFPFDSLSPYRPIWHLTSRQRDLYKEAAPQIDYPVFTDQPHLIRSLKRLIGQTPAQIIRNSTPELLAP
jgi:hypothetical protein